MKIAVLLTCFNRKEKTLSCLNNLFSQSLPPNTELAVYLVDDGSSDGTAEAVETNFPQVNVIIGSGSLFWAGGMRVAWDHGKASNADYYLLLNDDTDLVPDAIQRSLAANQSYTQEKGIPAICVGRTEDPDNGKTSYGGRRVYHQDRIQSYLVEDTGKIEACDMGEANMMLVPKAIFEKVGILSDRYVHAFADIDYTLRAIRAGFKVIIPPGYIGTCKDDHGNDWAPKGTNLSGRLKYMYSPKGLAYNEYMYFIGEYFPKQKFSASLKIWIKTLFPWVYEWFKKDS